jgi:hypothetical protein
MNRQTQQGACNFEICTKAKKHNSNIVVVNVPFLNLIVKKCHFLRNSNSKLRSICGFCLRRKRCMKRCNLPAQACGKPDFRVRQRQKKFKRNVTVVLDLRVQLSSIDPKNGKNLQLKEDNSLYTLISFNANYFLTYNSVKIKIKLCYMFRP